MIATIIRKLPASIEFCLVVLICFWWGIYGSMMAIAHHSWAYTNQPPERYAGLGIVLGEKGHKVIIVQAVPNSPAAKARLAGGLVIQKIGGTPTEGRTLQDCGALGRGPAGSKVTLELVDTINNKTNTVELTRQNIVAPSPRIQVTNRVGLRLMILELLGLAVTFWIARVRSWSWKAWGFQPSWKLTGEGVLLCLGTGLVLAPIALLTNAIFPGALHRHLASSLSLPFFLLVVLINPAFEEIIETGYFVQSLQRYGMWVAVLASALFRAFLHAYQGVSALLLVLPCGLIFGFVYWKWRCLWPLYIAHVIFDFDSVFPRPHGM